MSANKGKNGAGFGLGIAGLILGTLALPLALIPCTTVMGLVFAIVGVALSTIALTQVKKGETIMGMIIAALVISIISTCFAALRIASSIDYIKKFPWNEIKNKIEHIDENSEELEKAFEEEFEKELGDELEDVLHELEDELEEYEKEFEDLGTEIEKKFESLSDEEKARRLGRAAGKALKGFVDELSDSTEEDN